MKRRRNPNHLFKQVTINEDLTKAIDYLRGEAYYEQLDLSFRLQVCSEELYNKAKRNTLQLRCLNLLKTFQNNPDSEPIASLLDRISFRLYPKSLDDISEKPNDKNGRWISNLRTQRKYPVKNCDFFIELPLELRILETLWTVRVGRKLDAAMPESCYANRFAPKHHKNLFKLFFNQYKKWRDTGLDRAKKCLENHQSVVLLSLDISRCYYNVETSWNPIERKCAVNPIDIALTDILKLIQSRYLEVCRPFLKDCGIAINPERQYLLPIGLQSSRVLANWKLRSWDRKVQENLNPVYYGRYVDDMLIVLSNPPAHCTKNLQTLIKCFLIDSGLVTQSPQLDSVASDEDQYLLAGTQFKVKGSKLIGTFFDKNHSWAGLTSFIEELQRHNSEFRFLPTDDQGRELENTAFDILMHGSINKFRSILSICENGTELSKFISGEIIAHRLSATPLKTTIKEQLSRFWKGRNLFEFIRIWEKNFTLLFIKHEKNALSEFWSQTEELITRLEHANPKVLAKLKSDLREHRRIAFANTISLGNQAQLDSWIVAQSQITQDAIETAIDIRKAGFTRSQYIVWPFLQFSDYKGDLSQLAMNDMIEYLQHDREIFSESFRYIYEDEKQLFPILRNACRGLPNISLPKDLGFSINENTALPVEAGRIDISIPSWPPKYEKNIIVGVANLKVPLSDINASYEPGSSPNLNQERWQNLSSLLNLASKEKCDLLVLPEVSIPWAWFPLMVSYARRHKLGIIFGLEHLVVRFQRQNQVSNTVIAALPYIQDGITQCAVISRSKNHYAPDEKHDFDRLGYNTISPNPKQYHLIHWRGMTFTIFNCFELTDIAHRSAFRGRIDALFAVEWNRDTDYFSNIVESVARDLHCTVIQANTSDFGDSRIYTPFHQRYLRNIIRVKGGDNTTLLKTTLNFEEQRSFQQRLYSPDDERYKPIPAGFVYNRNQPTNREIDVSDIQLPDAEGVEED